MRQVAVVLLGLCLIGCQTHSDTPSIPQPPLAPAGPVSPDGTYRGVLQTTRGTELCGTGDSVVFTIRNNSLHYQLNQPQLPEQPVRVFDAPIGANGQFSNVSGAAFIRGTVKSGHMQGEISGDACGFAFEADRTGTW